MQKRTEERQRAVQRQVSIPRKNGPKQKRCKQEEGSMPRLHFRNSTNPSQGRNVLISGPYPAPMYDAPFYQGSGKLQNRVALITGGDSGMIATIFQRRLRVIR